MIYDYRQKNKIDWKNLKQDDVIYIYLDYTVTIESVAFWIQLNICFKILHDDFYKVYYGSDHVERIVQFGAKNSNEEVYKLMPEIKQNGYKLYD